MSKPDKRYTTLRKILKREEPRPTRAKNLAEAQLRLHKNYDQLLQRTKELQPEVDEHNKQVDAQVMKQLEIAAREMKQKGEVFEWVDRQSIEMKRMSSYRSAFDEAQYDLLQTIITELSPTPEPDIDNVRGRSIRPGDGVILEGTCFGPSQGKVLLSIAPGYPAVIVELEVLMWHETRVMARLNHLIGWTPLRPYYGRIWLQTGNRKNSNIWPMMYYPIYSDYIAIWRMHAFDIFGCSINDTFLEGRYLVDPDFTLQWIERTHSGNGWSKLQVPNASGHSLAQGYHIGVPAFQDATMSLLYRIRGPKGIAPPNVPELGPWGWLGDEWEWDI